MFLLILLFFPFFPYHSVCSVVDPKIFTTEHTEQHGKSKKESRGGSNMTFQTGVFGEFLNGLASLRFAAIGQKAINTVIFSHSDRRKKH